ncbi:MAG: GTPase ObgE [Thermodesulfobacteriota bacterium]
MRFLDEAKLVVSSGNGGGGCLSFRREKFIPRGGPDGGDGGKGGDVILAAGGKRTLYHFRFKHEFCAENGRPGQGSQKSGKSGADLILTVPPGTLVTDDDTGEVLADLVSEGDSVMVCRGGRGGKGNKHFATATHRTPRFSQPGEEGQTRTLRLTLKLIADVGIVGLPNAGKSSLIAAMSAARPEIAPYPFTTLTPNLGVVTAPFGEPFVAADIPGLIEGAHEGVGLGDRFLRHVERTRILVHLVDASTLPDDDPAAPLAVVNRELVSYNPALMQKPQIVVLNKLDIPEAQEKADAFERALGRPVRRISAATGQGVSALVRELASLIAARKPATEGDPE